MSCNESSVEGERAQYMHPNMSLDHCYYTRNRQGHHNMRGYIQNPRPWGLDAKFGYSALQDRRRASGMACMMDSPKQQALTESDCHVAKIPNMTEHDS